MMKKVLTAVAVATMALGVFAWPCHRGFGPGPRWYYGPHHHYHGGFWGPGGRNFWPGFIGGVVGGVVYDSVVRPYPYRETVVVQPAATVVTTPAVVTQPVVVQQPVVQQTVVQQPVTTVQNVWVEGRYVDQVQANGSTVRVWQPGHYEQRTVVQ